MDLKSVGGFSCRIEFSKRSSFHIDLTIKIRYNICTSKTIQKR